MGPVMFQPKYSLSWLEKKLSSIPSMCLLGFGNTRDRLSAIGTALLGVYFTVKSYPSTFSSILESLGGDCDMFFSAMDFKGL